MSSAALKAMISQQSKFGNVAIILFVGSLAIHTDTAEELVPFKWPLNNWIHYFSSFEMIFTSHNEILKI